MNLANAIVIAFVAGLASATLGAAALSGPGVGLFFVVIAPLPLMIVAFRWHPLMALLGGALTAAALAMFLRGSAAVTFTVLVTFPAYAVGAIFWRAEREGWEKAGLLCLAAGGVAALATLAGCLSISTSYAELEAQLLRQSEVVYRYMAGLAPDAPLTASDGQDPQRFITAYANAVAPLCCVMLTAIYLVNTWLAAKIAHKSRPQLFAWTPAYSMRLPRLMLAAAAGALIGGLLPGYPGLGLELIGCASLVCLTAQGYAAVHHATVGSAVRGAALTGLWALTFIFGLPVAIMLFAGVAEVAIGWRDRIVAGRNAAS